MNKVDTKNYEKYRTLCKIPVECTKQYGKSNTSFQKMQCIFCSEEWYVAHGKKNRVKVCPFCSYSINQEEKMQEKKIGLHSERVEKEEDKGLLSITNKNQITQEKNSNSNLFRNIRRLSVKVGSTIEFDLGLKWKILEKCDEGVLLICEEYDAMKPYHEGSTYIKWGTCTLREWLNDEFLRVNFREQEKKYILDTTLETKTEFQRYKTKWETTVDKIFIFNEEELKKYSHLLKLDNRECLLRDASPINGHCFVVRFKNGGMTDNWGVRLDYPSHIKPVMKLSWDYFLEKK